MKLYALIAMGIMLITSVAIQADQETFIRKFNELLTPARNLANAPIEDVVAIATQQNPENPTLATNAILTLQELAIQGDFILNNINQTGYTLQNARQALKFLHALYTHFKLSMMKEPLSLGDQNFLQEMINLMSLLKKDFPALS
jgi:hypothetical protein